jgi:hypothetical protein
MDHTFIYAHFYTILREVEKLNIENSMKNSVIKENIQKYKSEYSSYSYCAWTA